MDNKALNDFHRAKAKSIAEAAAMLGRISTPKKAESSRNNGKKGGWHAQKRNRGKQT